MIDIVIIIVVMICRYLKYADIINMDAGKHESGELQGTKISTWELLVKSLQSLFELYFIISVCHA